MFHVRLATTGDFPAIVSLVDEAAEWLRGMGTDQWAAPWPNRRKRDARIRRGLRKSRTWIVEDGLGAGATVVATITCRPDPNRGLWNKEEQSQRAVYVSRLVINRRYEGLQIGSELLEWAGKWARLQYDAQFIRVDTWTTNAKLHEYYIKRGFDMIRTCNVDYPSAAILQRNTEGLEHARTPRLPGCPQFQAAGAPRLQEKIQRVLAAKLNDLRPRVQSDSAAEIPIWIYNLYILAALIPRAAVVKLSGQILNHTAKQAHGPDGPAELPPVSSD